MKKSLLYRLFGIGKLPDTLMAKLQNEGLILMDDGVKGSVTYLDFHAPGKSSAWRRVWFKGSIALTKQRLLALSGTDPVSDVPLADKRIRAMQYSVEKNKALCIAFDASLFHADWSGRVEYRFRTPQAEPLLEALHKQIG